MTVIHLASRARPVAAPATPQVTTATIFQFPALRQRDRWDGMTWLTEEQKRANREIEAAGIERRNAIRRFGKRLLVARAILGLSIEAAAAAADIKPQTFKTYESGATEMKTARFLAFVNHPSVALRGFLLTWLLEDGTPADKERDIIAHYRSGGVQISHDVAGAINALDAAARMNCRGGQ
jgi:transcriptional regulator with XRE-family HTH domain